MVDATPKADEEPWSGIERAAPLLSHVRRYYVFFYLRNRDDPIDIEALAARLADWERTRLDRRVERGEVGNTLAPTRLPMLAEADVIEYDADAGVAGWAE